MNYFTLYIVGFSIALIWITTDYYRFNLKLGKDVRFLFNDTDDLANIFLFALGSWVTVLILFATNNKNSI